MAIIRWIVVGAIAYIVMLVDIAFCQTRYCDSALVINPPYGGGNELSCAGDILWWIPADGCLRSISLSNNTSGDADVDSIFYEGDGTPLDLTDVFFFNDSVGIVVGWKVDSSVDIEAVALRTIDRGRTWIKMRLPVDVPIYSIDGATNGLALAVGGAGVVLGTDDFGYTWKTICKIDNFGSIASVSVSAYGKCVAGGYGNSFAMSTNFGKDWTKFPTPADQLKGVENNNAIRQVAVLSKLVLVKQGERCFYSFDESISWAPIKHDVCSFIASDDTRKILITNKNNEIFIADPSLAFDARLIGSASSNIIAATSDTGEFYLMNEVGGIYTISDSELVYARPSSVGEQADATDMQSVRHSAGVLFGIYNSSIFSSDDWGKSWCRKWDATAEVLDFIPISEQRVVVFYRSIPGGAIIDEYGHETQIEGLKGYNIEKIIECNGRVIVAGRKFTNGNPQADVLSGRAANVLLLSIDNGLSWAVVYQDVNRPILVVFVDARGVCWVFTDSVLSKFDISNALGGKRQEFDVSYPRGFSKTASDVEIAMLCDSIGYGITWRGSHEVFLKTIDGGRTWSEINWQIFPFVKFLSIPSGLIYISYDRERIFLVDPLHCDGDIIFDVNSIRGADRYKIFNMTYMDTGGVLIEIQNDQSPEQVKFMLFDPYTGIIRYVE